MHAINRNLLLQADTSRVLWSWSSADPSSPSDITQHENQGTTSLNLLGGLNEPREDRSGAESFVIRNENVSVVQMDFRAMVDYVVGYHDTIV